jgi:hypothetical protein
LQVGHDGNFAAGTGSRFTDQTGSVDVILGFAVAEIEANDIHTSADHGF